MDTKTTYSPAKPAVPAPVVLPQAERVSIAVSMFRDQTRINREEDAWIRAGRPASTLLREDIRKAITEPYEAWIAGIAAANAANRPPEAVPVKDSAPVAAYSDTLPEPPVTPAPRRRRIALAVAAI